MSARPLRRAVVALAAAAAPLGAQAAPPAAPTATLASAPQLPLRDFYTLVLERHPVARQARLLQRQAEAELLAARGGLFDPAAYLLIDRKRFTGKTSYDYLEAGLKAPTPIGIDVKLGFERGRGTSINPEAGTPNSGQFVAGVTIPLARGIITDQRRNAVAQAAALRDQAIGERLGAVNKLLFSAVKEYAGWYETDQRRRIAREGQELAELRARLVRSRFVNGEAAALDTVEAALEVQRRTVARLEADAAFFSATQSVALFLWDADGGPLELVAGTEPALDVPGAERADSARLDQWLLEALRRHPEILKADAKVVRARADRLLAAQGLLPEASLSFSALGSADSMGFWTGPWPDLAGNQKLGFEGKQSLLLMKERGKLGATRAKLESAELDRGLAAREVRLAVAAAAFDLQTFEQVVARQAVAVTQARAMRDGEVRRFESGESTLFVVNLRERLLLDESVKLAAARAKLAGARAALAVALGFPAALPLE
ncbi:MAG: TolC family protein [Gemmatimonadales bacterium]|nr:TolC family protein [Gemmatimonadales bacterium]